MNELPIIDPSVCTKISAIATGASLFPAASSYIDSGNEDLREALLYLLNNHDM